jgi:hypothetical protein
MSINPASNASIQIWYQHTENALLKSITQGEYPYLGLYNSDFSRKTREFLDKQLRLDARPVNAFIQGLRKWPAIYACYLTLHVAESYGDETGRGVYPAISKAITAGRKDLTTHEREALWFAYRVACLKLGLAVSSRQSGCNYMINEYLQQSGVPSNYVEDLVKRMIRYVKKIGLPTDDNPQAIQQWTRSFADKLNTPVSITVRNAIENDEHGFYVRLFLKLIDNPELHSPKSDLEVAMAKAIVNFGSNDLAVFRRLSLPRLLWLDNGLVIELPAGEESLWDIHFDDEHITQAGKYELQLVPLKNALYTAITLSDRHSKNNYCFNLWPDHKDNRLLVFSSSGEFVTHTQLSADSDELALEPGHYQLVTRFIPKGLELEVEVLSENPNLYDLVIALVPDQTFVLQRGPVCLTIKADSKPYLYLSGNSYHDTKGYELYASAGFKVSVSIPKDYLQQTEVDYIVKLVPGDLGETVEFTLNPIDSQVLEFDFAPLASQWKAGVTRLLIELMRKDIARPIVRTSVLFWNGLETVENSNQFYCDRFPENLLLTESENAEKYDKYVSYKDWGNRFFRLCFQLGEHKKIYLSWFVAGVFMCLKDYSDSQSNERVLQKNSQLTVNTFSRSLLEVFSSKPGVLLLGGFSKNIGYKNKTVRLHLASLLEYLTPESHTLQFIAADSMTPEPLLNLVTSNELLSFKVGRKSDYLNVEMSLSHVVEAFRLKAIDQLTGKCNSFELVPDDVARLQNAKSLVNVMTTSNYENITHYLLQCAVNNWESGAWVISLEVKVNNRWGALCNSRQDHYAFGLLTNRYRKSMLPVDVEASLSLLSVSEILPILRRVHQTLLICYTQESWDEILWLKSLWLYLVSRFNQQKGELVLELLHLAAQYPPDTTSSGWVPILSLGATIPWVFSAPACAYKGFADRKENLLLAFKVFEKLTEGITALFINGVLDGLMASAFSNFHAIRSGAEPKKFSIESYAEALKLEDISSRALVFFQEDWHPSLGDFLGALHYKWAVKKFKGNYVRTSRGNDIRRSTALGLIKSCSQHAIATLYNDELPDSFKSYSLALLDELSSDELDSLSDEEKQLRENYLNMIHFLSIFAQVCRQDARKPGVLALFVDELSDKSGVGKNELQGVLGFLLFIGEDVFAFYLLLWEIVFQADRD